MKENDFKLVNNYTEQINQDDEIVNTCQDCTFSSHSSMCKVNELHCTQGDTIVSVNGLCKLFLNVLK